MAQPDIHDLAGLPREDRSEQGSAEVRDLEQIDYGKLAYDMALDAYNSEKTEQEHLWRRFRDAVKLMIVIATGLGGTTLTLLRNPYSTVSLLIALVSLTGFLALVASAWKLYAIFRGAPFERSDPDLLISQFHKRTREFSSHKPGRLLPIRGIQELKGGGALSAALFGTLLEDAATMTLEAAAANHRINTKRGRILGEAREWLVAALTMMFVSWVAVLTLSLVESSFEEENASEPAIGNKP